VNGRTLLQAQVAAFLAAALVSSTAAARPQGEPATTPATPATPTEAAKADEGKKDEAKDPAKKDDEDPNKKKTATPAEPGAAGAQGAGTTAPPAGEGAGVSVSIGGGDQPRKDEAKVEGKKGDDAEAAKNPFGGSILFWDHSVSTQTARMETSAQQSYIPLYEWWFSFQPRYHFNKKLEVIGRFDYTKELTNSQDSTYYREGLFGDIWATLRYATPISERLKNTKVNVSTTLKLPLSKESQAQGVYFKAGAGAGIGQKVDINGESAKWLQAVSFRAGASYEHAFSKATTPTGGSFEAVRQDTDGRTFVTDQITGGMLSAHKVIASIGGDLQITEKWGAGLSAIFINNWAYAPKDDISVRTDTGTIFVPRSGNATTFSQASWVILNTDYEVIDEMSVGIGYYNLAGIIAPDGQRRGVVGSHNIWWSPSARVFATVTANLDKIYDRAAGLKKEEKPKAALTQGTPAKL